MRSNGACARAPSCGPPAGDIIVRPSYLELAMRLSPRSSLSQHLLVSYIASFRAVLKAQVGGRREALCLPAAWRLPAAGREPKAADAWHLPAEHRGPRCIAIVPSLLAQSWLRPARPHGLPNADCCGCCCCRLARFPAFSP